jgi:hypothetical protein
MGEKGRGRERAERESGLKETSYRCKPLPFLKNGLFVTFRDADVASVACVACVASFVIATDDCENGSQWEN